MTAIVVKVTVRLMVYSPSTRKRQQHFAITEETPCGASDVVSIYMAITAKIPVRNVAVTKDDGGVIELSADKGQLTTRQIATLKSFCRKKIDQQIPPNARRRR